MYLLTFSIKPLYIHFSVLQLKIKYPIFIGSIHQFLCTFISHLGTRKVANELITLQRLQCYEEVFFLGVSSSLHSNCKKDRLENNFSVFSENKIYFFLVSLFVVNILFFFLLHGHS